MFISIPLLMFGIALATLMWSTGVWVALRQSRKERQAEEDRKLSRQMATALFGPADADGARAGGLIDQFEEHARMNDAQYANVATYTKVFTAKIAKLYRKNGWGSDEYVVAQVQAEIRGEYVPDPIDTGAHPVVDPHALAPLDPPYKPALGHRRLPTPIKREDDEDK